MQWWSLFISALSGLCGFCRDLAAPSPRPVRTGAFPECAQVYNAAARTGLLHAHDIMAPDPRLAREPCFVGRWFAGPRVANIFREAS